MRTTKATTDTKNTKRSKICFSCASSFFEPFVVAFLRREFLMRLALLAMIGGSFASSLLMAQAAGAPPVAPRLEFAMELHVQLGAPLEVGQVPRGRRRIVPIVGGTFSGPAIKGKVL